MACIEPADENLPALIAHGAEGDEAACAELYRRFSPPVLRLSLGLLGDLADAEEVTQDAFVYAFRNLQRYQPDRAAFSTWLYTIALSRCRNKRRRKLLALLPFDELFVEAAVEPVREVEVALERRGVRRQVWTALQALPARLREPVALRFLVGLRYRDVAQAVGCNPKTAESRVRLGLAAMRRALEASGVAEAGEMAEQWLA